MAIQIGAKPGSSFRDPLGLLSDCHRRIEQYLAILLRVSEAAETELTPDRRRVLEGALNYFREAAPRHTQDEEISLFPHLRSSESREAREAFAALERLEEDHAAANADHAEVDRLAWRWMSQGWLSPIERQDLRERVARLQSLYARHIAMEDTVIFPLAGRTLDGPILQKIGREMAARRGIDYDRLVMLAS